MVTAHRQRFNFCPKCGGKLVYRQVDERERLKCDSCSYIMYENPIVGVAAIVFKDGKLLLGRRGPNSTFTGKWCIPCGYVEYDEDVYSAAKREFKEETGLVIELDKLFTVLSNFHNPEAHTVGIWFQAHTVGGVLQAGDDIEAVGYFALDQLPTLAFDTDKTVIGLLRNGKI
jgi:ADP-ribose pyrophosphatase YjhB (NUDIX family)